MVDKLKRAGQFFHQRYNVLLYLFDPEEKGLQASTLFKMMTDLNMGISEEAFYKYMTDYQQSDGIIKASDLMGAILNSKSEEVDETKGEMVKKDTEKEDQLMKDIFDTFDREKKGAVEEKHFRETMQLLRIPLQDNHVMRMYKMFDLSGDNSIDFSEFLEGLNNKIGLKKIII
ncbi:hypothetical protein LOD99_15745 [Oopsacas minuta]|uniref:EF-hand domain-containing protein n=1 Tax=Oopsacas minuta TaxID=111878 RepID=A0AAV7KCJ8_9METZ|nr:hypothetical protein LOD99_15745 [Oopsacas minuta]